MWVKLRITADLCLTSGPPVLSTVCCYLHSVHQLNKHCKDLHFCTNLKQTFCKVCLIVLPSLPDSGAVAAAQVVRGSKARRALPGEASQLPPGPRISPHQRHHVLLHQGEVGQRLRPRGQGVLPVLGGGRVLVSTPLPGEPCMRCLTTPLLFVITL